MEILKYNYLKMTIFVSLAHSSLISNYCPVGIDYLWIPYLISYSPQDIDIDYCSLMAGLPQ